MKTYTVVLTSLVNASRDIESDKPETKDYWFEITAPDGQQAVKEAKERHKLSVWESDVWEA